MPSCKARPPWPALLQLWSDAEAEALLAQGSSQSALSNPRLQQMLAATKKILAPVAEADSINYIQAVAAVECQAVALLAKLLHLLQQQPSHTISSAASSNSLQAGWSCVLGTLKAIMLSLSMKALFNFREGAAMDRSEYDKHADLEISCREQLEEAGGEKYSNTASTALLVIAHITFCHMPCQQRHSPRIIQRVVHGLLVVIMQSMNHLQYIFHMHPDEHTKQSKSKPVLAKGPERCVILLD